MIVHFKYFASLFASPRDSCATFCSSLVSLDTASVTSPIDIRVRLNGYADYFEIVEKRANGIENRI